MAAAAEGDEAGDALAGGARAPLPLPPPSSPPATAAAAAAVPSPSPLAQKKVEEAANLGSLGNAAADGSLDPLDLAALAALGDDEQLAALLEGMLREGEGGDELFRRVFKRVDGAVTEALMMASAEEGAEGAGGGGGGGGGLEE